MQRSSANNSMNREYLDDESLSTPTSQGDKPSLFNRGKSSSVDYGNKLTKSALIVLHRDDVIQVRIAKARCESLGYKPIFVERPTKEDDAESSESIARIKETLFLYRDHPICFVLVEANYSHHGRSEPNVSLLRYIMNSIKPEFIFVTSSTEDCLESIRADDEFNSDIIITDPAYKIIKETMEATSSTNRKLSLPISFHY